MSNFTAQQLIPQGKLDHQFDQDHIWHPYSSMRQAKQMTGVISAQGCQLTLDSGERVIDGTSSWWACVHGYGEPQILAAMSSQLNQLSHVMFGGITHHSAIELCKRLVDITAPNITKVFLADSGSIAVEVALKMALQYWQGRNQPQKQQILTVKSGYHGDTFAAMSVCDPDNGMHTMFGDSVTQHLFAEAPNCPYHQEFDPSCLTDITQILKDEHRQIAAIIIEPILQGAGGMRFYHPDYLVALRKLCDKYKVLLILDEIATGFGRTGKLFAYEHTSYQDSNDSDSNSFVQPDILCLGKALTGGYISLAATLCSDEVAQGISDSPAGVFMHGPTFMGNPLACAAACASLDLLAQNRWQSQVTQIEQQLQQELAAAQDFPSVKDVRVLGAIGVIEMKETVDTPALQQKFIELGVWIRPFSRFIYIMPPYVISSNELTQLTTAMKLVAQSITEKGCEDSGFISHG